MYIVILAETESFTNQTKVGHKIINVYNIHMWKRNILEYLEMMIFSNNKLCICKQSAVHELVVVRICLNQSITHVGIHPSDIPSGQYCKHNSLSHTRIDVTRQNLCVFFNDLICNTQSKTTINKTLPNVAIPILRR